MKYIEEELTLAEFSSRFIQNDDFDTPADFDISDMGIDVLTLDTNGDKVYRRIQSFVVKNPVDEYYTDGKLCGSSNHRIIENGEVVHIKDHPDFNVVNDRLQIVDIEVNDLHSYLANGRLNHNTTSGGKAIGFHSSIQIRLKKRGKIKAKTPAGDKVVGVTVNAHIYKNRLGPPEQRVDFDILYDRGIDNYGSWFGFLRDNKAITSSGPWWTFEAVNEETGEVTPYKFMQKQFVEKLENDPSFKESVYNRICDMSIMEYQSQSAELMEVEKEVAEVDAED